MTTPNEFLQFAQEMGLGRIKSTSSSSSSPSQSISNNDGYTTTGLSVLSNLCRLIEQIHQLKAENYHLRAHLELVDHVEKFQQRFLLKDTSESKKEDQQRMTSSTSTYDEEKSNTLSPSSSLKIKRSMSNREQKRSNVANNQEDSSSMIPIDHEQSELIDNHLSASSKATWNKVRHALKFTLRRKPGSPASPPLPHVERQIPTISISIESDDDQLQENKRLEKKKKKIITTNDNRQTMIGEESDQDDESNQLIRAYDKRRLDGNETSNLSSIDRQETSSSTNLPFNTTTTDDEHLLTRKQSKIARYRRKLRSKLDTVKRQFSDQNSSSSSIRLFHNSLGSTFDDIGLGVNHALLTAQLAPALTKSYQQKMREWETMQKSDFLVNYRRRSITPKTDLNNNSRKASLSLTTHETSIDSTIPSSTMDNYSSIIDKLNLELEPNLTTIGPILSPNQRSLIVHQWREIMSEEISLRHYNEYLQKKMSLLKELETNLKTLKTNIFCTNHFLKSQSMINIQENTQHKQSYLPQRCHSLQSFISMPASWILAVQSAAYSDVLDGTSTKTTERAILFNKHFFDRLEHFKQKRQKFEQDSIKDLQSLNRPKKRPKTIVNRNELRVKRISTRGCLRKLSLISFSEFPQYFLPYPIIPLQTTISHVQPIYTNELLPIIITDEIDSNNKLSSSSSINVTKQSKRSRFDLKKTFQRSRSMCMSQFSSWLHRRRQQHSSAQRRKSATETKVPTPCSTPKLLGSPRLARLHQRIFKQQASPSPSPQTSRTEIPVQILDDSDNRSQYELPVRIYFPPLTAPAPRHVRITDINIITSNNDNESRQIEATSSQATPIMDRKSRSSLSSSPSFKMTTAKERRESFATLSNVFNNRCV